MGKTKRTAKDILKNKTSKPLEAKVYTDVDQRKEILSVRTLLVQTLKEELSAVVKVRGGKEMTNTRKLIQAAINQAVLEGEYKGLEVISKLAGVLDTHLLEMNFINDQRRIERNETINLSSVSADEKLELAQILSKIEENSFKELDAVFEEIEQSGVISSDKEKA